ncbi:PD-(D/E)XK nuclease family protein [Priestia megaterium]|uniref:PD-(D/E)XK nuclease family protein n=1 Tax=Priestia megaterium TaxID=1404 RepID=UPI0021F4DE6E|nr:PD-(D/E)XK nuclease family protein [Priestia megaterium]UYP07266.1 PD-(D/E)XK nuclease family protein [Priestia megaterium]
MNNEEMLQFIEDAFEENYELLKLEGGHALAPYVKKMALEQVKNYWIKLRNLAENVSDTEVKLMLPQQETPKGRSYAIQGVIDVVKEDHKTLMYDIKTHDVEAVRCNKQDYEGQLNIYAHIWQSSRGQQLDGAAVIGIGETEILRRAKQRFIQTNDRKFMEEALELWDPEVPIEITSEKVQEYLDSFGEVVDRIEDYQFQAPPIEKLKSKVQNNKLFAVHVCRNCDVRFSCESFQEYAFTSTKAKRNFLEFYGDYGTEHERVELIESNLEEEV